MHDLDLIGWRTRTLDALEAGSSRRSRARRAIVEYLAARNDCLSAADLAEGLRGAGSAVGEATVYRVLELLARQGALRPHDIGDGVTRYEPVYPDGSHHHHLVCRTCGRVALFEDSGLERVLDRVAGDVQFDAVDHEVVLYGTCRVCADPRQQAV
jgi:Fur family transcriptional regulator, ferric uptake regulator